MKLLLLSAALLAVFQSCNADQVTHLQFAQEEPYKMCRYNKTSVYVSATNDHPEFLSQIFIKDGNGVTKSALELRNSRVFQNRDLKNGWFTKGPLYLYTKQDHMNVYDMTGYVYCKELLPNKPNNFFVYDITQPNTISLQESSSSSQTVIVMNTMYGRNTNLYNFIQKPTQTTAIGIGLPYDVENVNSHVFRNPFSIDKISKSYFMNNVEPFTIVEEMFYGVFNGGVQFSVRPGKLDTTNYWTFKSSTTGLISKTRFETNENKKVTFTKSLTGATVGVSGFNAVGSIFNNTLTFDLTSSGTHYPTTIKNMDVYAASSIKHLADTFEVTPNDSFYYSVQYYNIEDANLVQ